MMNVFRALNRRPFGARAAGCLAFAAIGAQAALRLSACLLLAASAGQAAVPFTDITVASGLAALKAAQDKHDSDWWMDGLNMVDLDHDGRLDLFLSSHHGDALATLNVGGNQFIKAPGTFLPTEIHMAYDINEDGKLDFSATYEDGGGQWWLNASQPGTLSMQTTGKTRDQAREQAIIDINRDGKADWLRSTGQGISLDLGDGKGGFTESGVAIAHAGVDLSFIPADLDGDGFVDLVEEWGRYDAEDGNSRIWHNDGKGGFTDVTAASGLSGTGLSIKGAGDFNQDGYPDIIALEMRQFPPALFLNDGKGRFTRQDSAFTGPAGKAAYASWGIAVMTDIDNDGIADIIMNGRNFLKLYRGDGHGRFLYANTDLGIKDVASAAVDEGLHFGDIDGDGDLDIAGYTEIWPGLEFALYRNDLPARNWINVRPVGPPGNRGAAGSKIRLFDPATHKLLWYEEVSAYCRQAVQSYYAYDQTERHYGLGGRATVDVEVTFYPSGQVVRKDGVPAKTTITVADPGASALFPARTRVRPASKQGFYRIDGRLRTGWEGLSPWIPALP